MTRRTKHNRGTLRLEDTFSFGKHKGAQVEDVIDDDPEYIEWCCENDVVDFDEETLELISKRGIA